MSAIKELVPINKEVDLLGLQTETRYYCFSFEYQIILVYVFNVVVVLKGRLGVVLTIITLRWVRNLSEVIER